MTLYDNIQKLNIQQFKNSTNFNKLLQIFSEEMEKVKVVFEDLSKILNIDDAVGSQLDLLGDIVVEKRLGRNDEDFKEAIKIKIFKNTSTGRFEAIVEILKLITKGSVVVYSDNPPAAYTIYTNGTTLPGEINTIMGKLSSAGVGVVVYASDGNTPFIATDIKTSIYDLQDNFGNDIVDNIGSQIVVNSDYGTESSELQELFEGSGLGVVETLDLQTSSGDTIVTDLGDTIVCYDSDQNIIDGGLANIAYQGN